MTCSQDRMADHLVNILGDLLFTGPVDRDRSHLPSPEELRRKILLKGKKIRGKGSNGSASGSAAVLPRHFECPEPVDEEADGTGYSTPEIGT